MEKTAVDEIKRGDIFYVENEPSFLKAANEQGGKRPAVVIQNNTGNLFSPTVIVAYLTSRTKKPLPTHVHTCITPRPSTVMCEQIATVSKDRLTSYVCSFTEEEMLDIDYALGISLGLVQERRKENETF